MSLLSLNQAKRDDEQETPLSAWQAVAPYLPKDKVLWEPFYASGAAGNHLQSLGFEVVHYDEDFFQANHGDVVVSNPPFSIKQKVLERLKALDKPFVLLLPASVLGTKMLRNLFPDIQVLIPNGRINFVKDGEPTKGVWFASFWQCWKLNLPKDLTFLE